MRLAVVIERFESQHGGAERSTAQIVTGLRDRGHDVTVIAGCSPLDEPSDGFHIERFSADRPARSDQLVRFSNWARHLMQTTPFDASLSVTMAVPASVLQPRGGTIRETINRNINMRPGTLARTVKRVLVGLSPKQRLLLSLERQVLADPNVHRIIAVSRYVADQLKQHYRVDDDKVVVIPNAAEVPQVNAQERAQWRRSIREGFSIPHDGLVFLFAALNPRLKGADTLLHAAKLLADRNIPFTLLMAGKIGYAQQHTAAKLGMREHVRIVGPTQHMPRLYAASDVTVHPTFYDPSSKVVIESLMMGVPAISTSWNGASDFIVDPANPGDPRGVVIDDPGDPAALADAMARMADPAERKRCIAATAGLEDQLSMARHVEKLESVLAEVRQYQDVTRHVPGAHAVGLST